MDSYKARICWNSAGWEYPTGEAARQECRGSYVREHGFGHEEWLLNFAWQLGGSHYSFLQPINRSRKKLEGKQVELLLYAIPQPALRQYVGVIKECEVLTGQQAAEALAQYTARGWLEEMIRQVQEVGGSTKALTENVDPLMVFNIRFRSADFAQFEPHVEAAEDDPVRANQRYTLVSAPGPIVPPRRLGREGFRGPKNTESVTRPGVGPTVVERKHDKLQTRLWGILTAKYGDRVILERNGVDIQFTAAGQTTYVEVKSYSQAVQAVREALGQLLEYAYYGAPDGTGDPKLVIAAPGPRTLDVDRYLELLRSKFGLDIDYLAFNLGCDTIDL